MAVSKKRFWEIDFLRGIAVVMMVIFHTLFFMRYFEMIQIDLYKGFMFVFHSVIPILFVGLAGISLSIQRDRKKSSIFLKSLKRGGFVFFLGMLITLITYMGFERGTVIFGILHMIGASIIMGSVFARFRYLNLVIGLVSIIMGHIFLRNVLNFPWLLVFGFPYYGFYTFDYYPLFPWIGVLFIGMFVGKMIYPGGKRRFELGKMRSWMTPIKYLGRVSLWVYIIHIPVIFGAIYLMRMII